MNSTNADLKSLLTTGNFSDMVFVVKEGENRPVKLSAHKAIICARSPVFAAMFSNECRERQENKVNISDVPVRVFEELLQFMYTGRVSHLGAFKIELLMAADKVHKKKLQAD